MRRIRPDRPLTDAEKQARYRQRHPDKVRAYRRKYAKEHPTHMRLKGYAHRQRHPVFQYVQQYKAGHPCTDCGEGDPVVLEFDHVRGVKRFTIGNNVTTRSLKAVKAEIAKCDVVCANCHRRRTAQRVRNRLQDADGVSTKLLEQVFGLEVSHA